MIFAGPDKENLGDIRLSISKYKYFLYSEFVDNGKGYTFTDDLASFGLPMIAPTLLVVWT